MSAAAPAAARPGRGGRLATRYGLRAPFVAGSGLLLVMTLLTAALTDNRRVETALAEAGERADSAGAGPAPPPAEGPVGRAGRGGRPRAGLRRRRTGHAS